MSRWVILFIFILPVFLCKAQSNGLFDSALINKKTEQIVGTWYYGNKAKDTLVIRIAKVPMKLMHPQADFNFDAVLVWVYYKLKDSLLIADLRNYAPDKYTARNKTMSGTYLDYVDAVVLTYKDANFSWLSRVKLTLKKKKLFWEVRHNLDEENKRHNFFYPEKLVLRRMKKNLL